MKAYSIILRERVLLDCDEGMPTKQVAAKHRVCASYVQRLKQRRREPSSITPKAQRHGPQPRRAEQAAVVAEAPPDATLDELRRDHALCRSTSRRCGAWSAT